MAGLTAKKDPQIGQGVGRLGRMERTRGRPAAEVVDLVCTNTQY